MLYDQDLSNDKVMICLRRPTLGIWDVGSRCPVRIQGFKEDQSGKGFAVSPTAADVFKAAALEVAGADLEVVLVGSSFGVAGDRS